MAAVEFEFVEDASGGSFVATGELVHILQGHLARGEIEVACKLYEELGVPHADALIDSTQTLSTASKENLAKMFSLARDFGRAARAFELAGRPGDAARMFEQARDFGSAAQCYRLAGEHLPAARAFEKDGQLDRALKLYEEAGAHDALANCLARAKRTLEAADVYRQAGNVRGEVEMLRQLPATHPSQPAAAKRLARVLVQYGFIDDAVQALGEVLRGNTAARTDRELYQLLLGLLECQGKSAQADRVREMMSRLQAIPANGAAPVAAPAASPAQNLPADGYAFLKAIPIFAELSLEDMKDLYLRSREVSFAEGATLLEQGVDGPGLFVILEGTVDVLAGGRLLNTLAPSVFVGEISLLQKAPVSARVVVRTAVRALLISRESFEDYVYNHEAAALRIYRLFSQGLADRVRVLSAQAA